MPHDPPAESFRLVQGNGGEDVHTAPSCPLKVCMALCRRYPVRRLLRGGNLCVPCGEVLMHRKVEVVP